MNREEIPQASRNENKNKDLAEWRSYIRPAFMRQE